MLDAWLITRLLLSSALALTPMLKSMESEAGSDVTAAAKLATHLCKLIGGGAVKRGLTLTGLSEAISESPFIYFILTLNLTLTLTLTLTLIGGTLRESIHLLHHMVTGQRRQEFQEFQEFRWGGETLQLPGARFARRGLSRCRSPNHRGFPGLGSRCRADPAAGGAFASELPRVSPQ